MAIVQLSKRTVDELVPGTKQFIVYDAKLKGFGIRVSPGGRKAWVIEYRSGDFRTGSKQRVTLGTANELTPDQARKAAKELLAGIRLGSDPAAHRRAERAIPTLSELIDTYMREEVEPKRAKGTAKLYDLYFKKHIEPVLGARRVTMVTPQDVAQLHRKIGQDRKVTANRAVKALSGLFTFGGKNGITPAGFNPTKGIELFDEQGRERYLTMKEIQRLGAAMNEAETIGLPWNVDNTKPNVKHAPKEENRREIYSPYVTAAIRLLMFTGCRLREVLHLRWCDVDFDRGMLFLPTSKTGKKTVVLSTPALEVLATLPHSGTYVIAGLTPDKPRSDLHRPWSSLCRRAGLQGLRIHDLRHTFASLGVGASLGLPIVGKLLGHSQTSTTQKYAHLDANPLRRAANQIGSTITGALGHSILHRQRQ